MDVDITKPLPFSDNSVDAILIEHTLEHVTIHDAWNFIEDCYRILRIDGILRISVPSVSKIYNNYDQNYLNFIRDNHWGNATIKDAIKSIIFNHEHKTIWEYESLKVIGLVNNFKILTEEPSIMKNTLNHHKITMNNIDDIESIVIDLMK
jgi:predicted SAM-dependent methyltransferase